MTPPPRAIAVVLCALVVSACSTPTPTPTVRPSDAPTTPASPAESLAASPRASSSASPTATPAPTPRPVGQFGFEDILLVEASSVPVRVAPLGTMPLVTGWQDGLTDIGEVSLNAGDFVSVDLGPLLIGDTTWYRVLPAENGVLHASSVWWDSRFDGPNGIEPGWIAAAVGEDEHVSLQQPAERIQFLEGLPLLASATGDNETDAFQGFDRYLVEWAYAGVAGQPTQCEFYLAVVAEDDSASLIVLDGSQTGVGAYHEGITELGVGDGRPVVGEEFMPLRLVIGSPCTWSIRVEPLPHD